MRLYSRMGVTALDDPEYGNFQADETGAFDFPDGVSDRLHGFHYRGKPMWETDIERQNRLINEELERRKDPRRCCPPSSSSSRRLPRPRPSPSRPPRPSPRPRRRRRSPPSAPRRRPPSNQPAPEEVTRWPPPRT
ncbi:hypothetical protein ACFQ3Z_16020 [Streptomyces nogalater]